MKKALTARRFVVALLGVTMFFSSIPVAHAQGLASLTGNIGPVAAAAISCAVGNLTGGVKGIFKNKGTNAASSQVGGASGQHVPIGVAQDSAEAGQTATETAGTSTKLNCTNAIAKAAAQVLIRQITDKTVAWINNGFEGEPLYIRDTASFLKGIRNQAIGQFRTNLADPDLYPFGRQVMRGLLSSVKTYFEQNAQYSLNAFLAETYQGRTYVDFEADFAIGGWDAFLVSAMPNNNPYGFSLAADQEIAGRISGTTYPLAQEIQDQIDRGLGFLDLKNCVDPEGYDAAAYQDALRIQQEALSDPNASAETKKNYGNIAEQYRCKRFETKTPGSVIANQLFDTLGSPLRQLEIGQDLTASLTAIFDALLNQLVTKGLSSLEADKYSDINFDDFEGTSYIPNVSFDGTSGDWSLAGNEFDYNVFYEIPELLSRERDFIESGPGGSCGGNHCNVLQRQIEEARKLIPTIYQLDYCIPGPHPGWQQDAREQLEVFLNDDYELPKTSDGAISTGAKILSRVTDPLGFFREQGKEMTADNRNKKMYSQIVSEILGVGVARDSKVNGYLAVTRLFRGLLDKYIGKVEQYYSSGINENGEFFRFFPTVRQQAEKEFKNIEKYETGIRENEELIAIVRSTVGQLERLQKRVEALPTKNGYPSETSIRETLQIEQNVPLTPKLLGEYYLKNLESIRRVRFISDLNDYEREIRYINDTFNLIAPDIHSEDDLSKELATLDDTINKIDEMDLLLDECLSEVSSQDYLAPTIRLPYPAPLSNPSIGITSTKVDNLPVGISFLPGFEYGIPNVTEIPSQYNQEGHVTAVKITKENVIGVWELFTVEGGVTITIPQGMTILELFRNPRILSAVVPFEQLIGIY